jgi:hypothetical protein
VLLQLRPSPLRALQPPSPLAWASVSLPFLPSSSQASWQAAFDQKLKQQNVFTIHFDKIGKVFRTSILFVFRSVELGRSDAVRKVKLQLVHGLLYFGLV